ncbi:MAG: dienelactone hydrolase family protein [Alphaproteobacteria bacterium]|nr:dienelactone hydrolase family protein [Rhodospirillaceae bacterium]MBT6202976.1 dienelactone hydrolase family protein [Rhodospirillaceae bacterium]MBT6512857.1 dienelactone hydrolase family protein [Rhodospirillaceae bacterium]MBT7648574.1 dienelactone hydrolase family protein [Rhodospirillaceae bacterium]MDG2480287.1 dienelactone hydrolase family protein [Alphaproteobacteria bacterium]
MFARREVLGQLITAPVAAGGLAAVLANPDAARAAASSLETVEITTGSGLQVQAAWGAPAQAQALSVLLVHEWWGLNDSIKAVAAQFVAEGYGALAVDLYGGRVADNGDDARSYMNDVEDGAATEILAAWIDWLRAREDGTGAVATVGWCFGGGWSLNASMARPVEATVVYYGNVSRTAEELAALEGPVLGHFATRDQWINDAMVDGFTGAMMAAQKPLTVYWYEADHAFANPTSARYDEDDAALSWQRTLAFLDETLA